MVVTQPSTKHHTKYLYLRLKAWQEGKFNDYINVFEVQLPEGSRLMVMLCYLSESEKYKHGVLPTGRTYVL